MAHALDTNKKTGRKAMFSVKETPWHKEGFVLDIPPSFEEAMHLAGCDYTVECRPVWTQESDGTFKQAETGQAVIRTDRNVVLKVMGDTYKPLQNRIAFEVTKPLVDKGLATYETGGTLREGADAWLMLKFVIDNPVVKEVFTDEVIPYGLISNNHTGTARCILKETPIRVVCANTLGASLAQKTREIKVKHRGNPEIRVVEAAQEMYAGLVDRYVEIANQYKMLKATRLSEDEFVRSVLDTIAPMPNISLKEEDERGYALKHDRATAKRSVVTDKWTGGKGHTGDMSAWEAYNGAVQVIDHDTDMFRTNAGNSRVGSLLNGRLDTIKTAVLESVLAVCQK